MMENRPNYARVLACGHPAAIAMLRGSAEYADVRGTVYLYSLPNGQTLVQSSFRGLPVCRWEKEGVGSFFALHIHEGMSCSGNKQDPFADAGMHYNPGRRPHPDHAGDLPPILALRTGRGWQAVLTDRFSVGEVLGRTVILHRHPDDMTTQPAGNAGERMACGVIRACR